MRCSFKQGFHSADGFWRQENIAANVAHLRRNVVNDDYLAPAPDRVDNDARFVLARASPDRTLHGWLVLFRGVTHLGGLGS